ncbi:MAG: glycosyltransferase family 4 protein [Defluviitaleaceae bacterium]|nr:glycosyltransferase family 4 protein [Defluviitaleaceae bacterium]
MKANGLKAIMIKILHIVTDTNIGGTGHLLLHLLDAYDKSSFVMEVVLPENARLTPLLAMRGVKYYESPDIADKSFSFKGISTLRKLIKEAEPDIVHTHGSFSGRKAAKQLGVKVVHTRHCAYPVASWKKVFPFKQMMGFVNNSLSDLMIAISPAAAENLIDMGARQSKIRTLFNGTPPVRSYSFEEVADIKRKYNIPPDTFVLAIIARLTEVKGHDDILDAAKAVPKALILFAGDGEQKTHLEGRIATEGISNVRLLGFVTDVDELIAVMDAQINASFGTETSSLSLIQGMSAGVPAVASDFGGNPYLIETGVNGIVFPARDANAMADGIKKIMSDSELYRRTSEGARQVYQERFTDKKMASDTEAVYKEVLGR